MAGGMTEKKRCAHWSTDGRMSWKCTHDAVGITDDERPACVHHLRGERTRKNNAAKQVAKEDARLAELTALYKALKKHGVPMRAPDRWTTRLHIDPQKLLDWLEAK